MNTLAIMAAITKNADSNASFSSVTAATEPTMVKKYLQSRTGCYYFLAGEKRGGGACPGTFAPDHFKFASYRADMCVFVCVCCVCVCVCVYVCVTKVCGTLVCLGKGIG